MNTPWAGQVPNRCQICSRSFSECRDARDPESKGETFIDGRTLSGKWANMGEGCFKIQGVGLGLGKGQRWNWITGQKVEPTDAEKIRDVLDL